MKSLICPGIRMIPLFNLCSTFPLPVNNPLMARAFSLNGFMNTHLSLVTIFIVLEKKKLANQLLKGMTRYIPSN